MPLTIGPYTNSSYFKLPKAITLPENPHKCALQLNIKKDNKKIAENLWFYLPDKYIDWPKPNIKTTLLNKNDQTCSLKVQSNVVIKDLYLYTQPNQGRSFFEDNYIDLIPGSAVVLKINNNTNLKQEHIKNLCVNQTFTQSAL